MKQSRTIAYRSLIVVAATVMLASVSCAKGPEGYDSRPKVNPEAPWRVHIQRMEDALAKKHIRAAAWAWRDAYIAGLGSRRWEGLLEVGEARLRFGEAPGERKAAEAEARRVYLIALFRARHEGTVEGVLRIAEAFAALGDHEVVDRCLRIAERLAAQGRDPQAGARVLAFRERLGRVQGGLIHGEADLSAAGSE